VEDVEDAKDWTGIKNLQHGAAKMRLHHDGSSKKYAENRITLRR
jgi:hypothetical protein